MDEKVQGESQKRLGGTDMKYMITFVGVITKAHFVAAVMGDPRDPRKVPRLLLEAVASVIGLVCMLIREIARHTTSINRVDRKMFIHCLG
jgi:hypothetical protein